MSTNWYQEVFKGLDRVGVRYVLVGGIALNLHGIPRMTSDMDIVVQLESDNLSKFIKIMNKLGLKPKVPVDPSELLKPEKRAEWADTKNMTVFSFVNPDLPYQLVDVFIKEPVPFKELWRDRKIVKMDNIKISLVSIDHLIVLKKHSARLQDISDIDALKKLKREI